MNFLRALAFAAVVAVAVPVSAADNSVPPPEPFAARSCLTLDASLADVRAGIRQMGGLGAALDKPDKAQTFADHWRKVVGLPPVKVTAVLFWVVPGLQAEVGEFGATGCLVTLTTMTVDQWSVLLTGKPLSEQPVPAQPASPDPPKVTPQSFGGI